MISILLSPTSCWLLVVVHFCLIAMSTLSKTQMHSKTTNVIIIPNQWVFSDEQVTEISKSPSSPLFGRRMEIKSANIRLNQCAVRLVLFCNVVGVLVEVSEGISDCRGRGCGMVFLCAQTIRFMRDLQAVLPVQCSMRWTTNTGL